VDHAQTAAMQSAAGGRQRRARMRAALMSRRVRVRRPLLVVGKGAAYAQADAQLRALADATGVPVLATAMGRGVVPDSHPASVQAARSAALRGADVALVFGARRGPQSSSCLPSSSVPSAHAARLVLASHSSNSWNVAALRLWEGC